MEDYSARIEDIHPGYIHWSAVEETRPVGTMQQALQIAVTADLDAADLDISLAGENVWPAARAVAARGIPILIARGYSDTLQPPPDLRRAPRIEKPRRRDRLVTTLTAAVAATASACSAQRQTCRTSRDRACLKPPLPRPAAATIASARAQAGHPTQHRSVAVSPPGGFVPIMSLPLRGAYVRSGGSRTMFGFSCLPSIGRRRSCAAGRLRPRPSPFWGS